MHHPFFSKKSRLYLIASTSLVVGAIFYGGNAVHGGQDTRTTQGASVTQTTQSTSTTQVANPIEAGAEAAKPNGVPTCLASCEQHEAGEPGGMGETHEGAPPPPAHGTQQNTQSVQASNNTGTQQTGVSSAQAQSGGAQGSQHSAQHLTASNHNGVQQTGISSAQAQGNGAKASAVVNNNTTNNTVVKPTQVITRTQPEQEQTAPAPQQEVAVAPEATEVPAPAETQAPVTQTVVQPAPQPTVQPVAPATVLPATGTAASSILGTTAIIGAAFIYLRSRRRRTRPDPIRLP